MGEERRVVVLGSNVLIEHVYYIPREEVVPGRCLLDSVIRRRSRIQGASMFVAHNCTPFREKKKIKICFARFCSRRDRSLRLGRK